jgi:hypothetical protein
MTRGVLIFAQNNAAIDYTKMAVFAAGRVKKFLNVPVSIVTDSREQLMSHNSDVFDQIIDITDTVYYTKYFYDGVETSVSLPWKNTSRSNCFYLSPYDETLVIDADFIINSSTLDYCWNQPGDFLIYKKSFDLAQRENQKEFSYISEYSTDFYWATVFWFRKNTNTEAFFNLVSHIKDNWGYYKFLYQIHSTNFRNDLAFSIAIHMTNGFTDGTFAGQLPGKLFYIHDMDILTGIDGTNMNFLVQHTMANGGYIPAKTSGIDVHIMNKHSLLRVIDNE